MSARAALAGLLLLAMPAWAREFNGAGKVSSYFGKRWERLLPAAAYAMVGPDDVVRAGSGVRAQALDRDGSLVDDFRIHQLGPVTAVRNAPSPAATSCMAIAEHVLDVLDGTAG